MLRNGSTNASRILTAEIPNVTTIVDRFVTMLELRESHVVVDGHERAQKRSFSRLAALNLEILDSVTVMNGANLLFPLRTGFSGGLRWKVIADSSLSARAEDQFTLQAVDVWVDDHSFVGCIKHGHWLADADSVVHGGCPDIYIYVLDGTVRITNSSQIQGWNLTLQSNVLSIDTKSSLETYWEMQLSKLELSVSGNANIDGKISFGISFRGLAP